jgi:hypothetical protein
MHTLHYIGSHALALDYFHARSLSLSAYSFNMAIIHNLFYHVSIKTNQRGQAKTQRQRPTQRRKPSC